MMTTRSRLTKLDTVRRWLSVALERACVRFYADIQKQRADERRLPVLLSAIMLEGAEATIVRTMCASSAMPFLIPAAIVAAKSP